MRPLERAGRRAIRALSRTPRPVLTCAAYGTATAGAVMASLTAASGAAGILGGALAVVAIAIAAIDARRFIIPDGLVLAGVVLGFVNASIAQPNQWTAAFASAAMRGAVLALLFLGFRAAYRGLRNREGVGLGDVKLAAMAGVWLSWTSFAVAVDLAALSALALVLLHILRGRHVSGATAIPFGLFFAPAIWLAWLLEAVSARLMS
jgi:leader peptidase (prepilin peptidase) / N-methyltransferase